MRMLFAWFVIWPNDELPNAAPPVLRPAHCTWLNRFSTSMRIERFVGPPVRRFLLTDRSTLLRHGERMPGSVRGALPNWFSAVAWNAALFRYRLSFVLVRMRSVMSPGTRKSWPGTRFGRSVPPRRNCVPFTFWLTPIGKPLLYEMTVVTDHPPKNASARPLDAIECPAPKGRLTVGARMILCGESSRLRPY